MPQKKQMNHEDVPSTGNPPRRVVSMAMLKGSKEVRRPWVDGPWPLLETPGRTQLTNHPALHIANDIAHIHNAMIRCLNALFIQAPHVRTPTDVADFLFLAQSWAAWVRDYHALKEKMMYPGFEAVLGLPAGCLGGMGTGNGSPGAGSMGGLFGDGGEDYYYSQERSRRQSRGEENLNEILLPADSHEIVVSGGEEEEGDHQEGVNNNLHLSLVVERRLQHLHAYASTTAAEPEHYSWTKFQALLAALAPPLVHGTLAPQIPRLVRMRDLLLCSGPSSSVPAIPVPIPITSPGSSSSSNASLRSTSSSGDNANSASSSSALRRRDPLARANDLLQVYLAAEAAFNNAMDRHVVPPMIVRLRDVTYETPGFGSSVGVVGEKGMERSKSKSKSRNRNRDAYYRMRASPAGGLGVGAGRWPRLTVPAVHAVADVLSRKHRGSWRFLPCDVWGRPRELGWVGGEGEGEGEGGESGRSMARGSGMEKRTGIKGAVSHVGTIQEAA
ncbi:hypothetical protein F4778DRAFT_784720 [Xylariomycetidae sp. FL2044]|nr:hypothetical protein F4778DRAFT_784720 [Xylariomycetidae sp. FL2044]